MVPQKSFVESTANADFVYNNQEVSKELSDAEHKPSKSEQHAEGKDGEGENDTLNLQTIDRFRKLSGIDDESGLILLPL